MSKNNMMKIIKKRTIIVSAIVIAIFITFIGGSYSWLNSQKEKGEYNYFEEENFELSYSRSDKGYSKVLSLINTKPITDKEGSSKEAYRFSITNISDEERYYKLKIKLDNALIEADDCSNKQLSTRYIKYKLDNDAPKSLYLTADKDYEIYLSKQTLMPGTSEIHELRIWVDENSPSIVFNKHFHAVVNVETADKKETYKEYTKGQEVELLNGNRYYVINDSDNTSSKVTLISKYNVSKVGLQDEKCNLSECSMTYDEALKVINGRFLNELKISLKGQETRTDNIEVRLISKEEINESMTWLASSNIWTQSEEENNNVYVITSDGINYNLNLVKSNDNYGLKPVIVIEKENIK